MDSIQPMSNSGYPVSQPLTTTDGQGGGVPTAARPDNGIEASAAGSTGVNPAAADRNGAASADRPAGSGELGSNSSILSQSSIANSDRTTVTTVQQQVDSFLGSISPQLANNEYLKLLIAAMIMQYLLGDEGGAQRAGETGMQMLESLSGGRNSSLYMAMETSTNSIQVEQLSTRLDVAGAVQGMQSSGEEPRQSGGQMDVTV